MDVVPCANNGDMFARKMQSVLWNDEKALREGRVAKRNFESLYVFDDGYETKEELIGVITTAGIIPNRFVYICFCEMWYAVHIYTYERYLVISKESIYYRFHNSFEPGPLRSDGFPEGTVRYILPCTAHNKKWQDGVARDILMADPDIHVEYADGSTVRDTSILWNNTVITFGRMFFAREIRITTDSYTSHVLSNYYNDRSLNFEYDRILQLRREGYMYYNPFTGEASKTPKERSAKEKMRLEGHPAPSCIKREEFIDGVKLLRDREVNYPDP